MDTSSIVPPGHTRPFKVHFFYLGEPTSLLVLAKSKCHAVQVMFRYFEMYYRSIDCVDFDRNNKACYVEPLFYFSDSLYNHLKTLGYGNN